MGKLTRLVEFHFYDTFEHPLFKCVLSLNLLNVEDMCIWQKLLFLCDKKNGCILALQMI
jgi:hypothetical protein